MPVTIKASGANLFGSSCNILVNPTSLRGVIATRLGAEFCKRFPGYYEDYRAYYKEGSLIFGRLHLFPTPAGCATPFWVVSIPVADRPSQSPNTGAIVSGLRSLARFSREQNLSVALPALGCSENRLPFLWLSDEVEKANKELCPALQWELYAP